MAEKKQHNNNTEVMRVYSIYYIYSYIYYVLELQNLARMG